MRLYTTLILFLVNTMCMYTSETQLGAYIDAHESHLYFPYQSSLILYSLSYVKKEKVKEKAKVKEKKESSKIFFSIAAGIVMSGFATSFNFHESSSYSYAR